MKYKNKEDEMNQLKTKNYEKEVKMTREEFKKMYENYNNEALKEWEGEKVVFYVRLESVYNKAVDAFRPLENATADYAMKYRAYITEVGHRKYDEMGNYEANELLEKLKKNKIINFFVEKKIPFEVEIEVIPSSVDVCGEPHHFTAYAKITVNKEYLYLYYGQGYKRKVFIFLEDGMLILKYPPYNLQDNTMDIGIFPTGKILKIVS